MKNAQWYRSLAGVAAVLLVWQTAVGQPLDVSKRGTTAAPFLTIAQGARAVGMGGAFVAVADDPSSMYWNPAGIADVPSIGVIAEHTQWIADIQYNYLGLVVSLGDMGAVGLNLTSSSIGDMRVTTIEQQQGTGEIFGVADIAFGLSYGIKLTPDFSIGFNPKFVYQKIWKMSASAFAVDMGVRYRTPFPRVTLGMSISNFGTKMQMEGNNALVLYDADPDASGNNGRIPASLTTDEWELPLNYRVGISYDIPAGELGSFVLAVDAQHPSDEYESVSVGGEYVFDDFLFIRGGYRALFLQDAEERFTAGLGIRQFLVGNVRVSLDYAYLDFGRLKSVQKISLGVMF